MGWGWTNMPSFLRKTSLFHTAGSRQLRAPKPIWSSPSQRVRSRRLAVEGMSRKKHPGGWFADVECWTSWVHGCLFFQISYATKMELIGIVFLFKPANKIILISLENIIFSPLCAPFLWKIHPFRGRCSRSCWRNILRPFETCGLGQIRATGSQMKTVVWKFT